MARECCNKGHAASTVRLLRFPVLFCSIAYGPWRLMEQKRAGQSSTMDPLTWKMPSQRGPRYSRSGGESANSSPLDTPVPLPWWLELPFDISSGVRNHRRRCVYPREFALFGI